MKPRTLYLLCLWGGIAMLLTVVSGYFVDARGAFFLGSEVSKATAGIFLLLLAWNARKKIKN